MTVAELVYNRSESEYGKKIAGSFGRLHYCQTPTDEFRMHYCQTPTDESRRQAPDFVYTPQSAPWIVDTGTCQLSNMLDKVNNIQTRFSYNMLKILIYILLIDDMNIFVNKSA